VKHRENEKFQLFIFRMSHRDIKDVEGVNDVDHVDNVEVERTNR